ncbi:MAG: aldehyde dehydrogenase family protein [Dehalococcoidia bacterium]
MYKTFKNYVNGEWVKSDSNETISSINPADNDDVLGLFQASTTNDADHGIDSAYFAKKEWSNISQVERGNYLLNAAKYLEKNSERFAESITRECGKAILESRGEVGRAIALLQYYGIEGSNPIGDVVPSINPKILLYTKKIPLGVVSLITPWNFPLAIPIWKMAPALVYGNTVVLKPASATPLIATLIAEMWDYIGLPNGVFNLIVGSGSTVGERLINNPKVNAVSFTGSTNTGKDIAVKSAQNGNKFQLEMGGKNPVIVLPDADLNQAAEITISGAMKYSGQKCTATSRVIVVGDILEKFTELLIEKTKSFSIGPGLDEKSTVVPVIDKQSLDNIENMINKATKDGAEIIHGGSKISEGVFAKGNFIQPTILSNVEHDSFIACEEVFGPVLSIIRAKDYDEAIEIANSVQYGLSAAIFTKSLNLSMDFAERIEAGVIKINGETAGLEPQVPFGGLKSSSSGNREQGKAAIEFFTNTKTIYVDRSAT